MAEVFLAVAQGPGGFNKLLVTKVLRSSLVDDDTFRKMFLDEARLAARMNHPNIPQTYEVGESDGHHFLTMEYLEGQPLHRVNSRLKEAFPLEHRVRVLTQVLTGLHYAHELTDYDGSSLSVVHRDISPHNVFVTYDGQVKLMDFGIAKAANASTETATGVIKGKISYMAPEQALALPVDRRSDIFAVGVMLWEALANQRLNAGDVSDVATLQKRVTKPVESPAALNPSAPQELVDICMRAVAFDAKDRFGTAAEMQEALESYLERNALAAKPRDLGKLVTEAFAAQRSRLHQAIEKQLTVAKAAGSNLTLVDLARDATGSRSGVVGGEEAGSSSGVGPMARSTPASHRPRMSNSKIAAMAMIPLAAVGIFVAASRRGVSSSANGSGQMNTTSPSVTTKTTSASISPSAPSTNSVAASSSAPAVTTAPSASAGAPPIEPSASSVANGGKGATPTTPNRPPHNPSRPNPTRTVDDKDPYAQ